MTVPEAHRSDCDLRQDVRRLLAGMLDAVGTARRWQLVSVAGALVRCAKVLGERPREGQEGGRDAVR